jgi:hypothetical protein
MASLYKVGDEVTHKASGKKVWKIASIHHNIGGIKTIYIIVPKGKNEVKSFTVARAGDLRKVKK